MTDRRHSFDVKCYELAEHFYPGAPKALLDELAQRFQDQVEGSASSELDAWQTAWEERQLELAEEAAQARRDDWAGYYP